ncbi:ArsR/SmtB family transcription factor [Psychromicrobium xiongbiense]|uniref:ArsR/SmtB family transcription factor n=1 Tax=Psychromicrobium xiongbiense TaxID=3051184 RepID=UPI0025576EA9|nr:metalloregulator ArsR/SmtB family transcription factor [Psychromicrobium sp. YIM S02556]
MAKTLEDPLSRTFAALADPTRRAILARLTQGTANVGDLAEPFEMSVTAVSKHLRVLEGAGLVSRGRDAQYRPAMLDARPLAMASQWIDGYRGFWGDSFDALDDFLVGATTVPPLTASIPADDVAGKPDEKSAE